MKIVLPEKVNTVLRMLTEHGYEAYAVGGCVRDALLGRTAEDWDITTSASPYEVKTLFRRTVDTGIRHGTVTVLLDKEGFEVTTYRVDGEYEDGRHPKEVQFTKQLSEDLRRRDFTINAMAYYEESGLVDLFGGEEDLKNRIIRCVGEPGERFDEDALRILRAFRFSAQLDFRIEEATLTAASVRAENLRKISAERIRTELDKLLLSEHPDRLLTVYEAGITRVIFPEFDAMMRTTQNNRNHVADVGTHTLRTVSRVGSTGEWSKRELRILRWSALLHDVAKPECQRKHPDGSEDFPQHAARSAQLAKKILLRLKFDRETMDMVTRLIAAHDEYCVTWDEEQMRRMLCRFGPELLRLLFALQEADVMAQSDWKREEKLSGLSKAEQLYRRITQRGDCICLKQLAITGNDLLRLGFAPGKGIGEELSRLLEEVLITPTKNTKEVLTELAEWHLQE